MKKNVDLMELVVRVLNDFIEKYEVSKKEMFGFSSYRHFMNGVNAEEVVKIKDELHDFFRSLNSEDILSIIPIDRLVKKVNDRFGLLGLSYMERSIIVWSEDQTIKEFRFPKWDEVMKRFIRNITKIGRIRDIFTLSPYSHVWTRIRFTDEGDCITFDGTILEDGEDDRHFYCSADDWAIIREDAWMMILRMYDLQDLKDFWY